MGVDRVLELELFHHLNGGSGEGGRRRLRGRLREREGAYEEFISVPDLEVSVSRGGGEDASVVGKPLDR